jgi:hypothetical protein
MDINHCLVLAWGLGIKELLCYSDYATVIKLICDPVNAWHHYAVIILNIKDLFARDWRVKVVYTLREYNVCADFFKLNWSTQPGGIFPYSYAACWNESSPTSRY